MNLELRVKLKHGPFTLDVNSRFRGQALGIFGRSGCGKTTLLSCLAGLRNPDSGFIELNGEPLFDSSTKHCIPAHRRRIGVVFQDDRLFPHWSAERNICAGLPRGRRSRWKEGPDFESIVELLRLGPLLSQSVQILSGGEKQRVALARALLANPRLLLLDEPLTGLEAGMKKQILPYLVSVQRTFALPFLVVSHDLSDILHFTDHLLLLDNGRSAATGRLNELMRVPFSYHLLREADAVNVIPAVLERHEPGSGLTRHRTPDGSELISSLWQDIPTGEKILIGLKPEEISLATGDVSGLSARNRIRGRVKTMTHLDDRVLCEFDACGSLLADVTPWTIRELGLAPGKLVTLIFQARSLRLIGGTAPAGQSHETGNTKEHTQFPGQEDFSCGSHA